MIIPWKSIKKETLQRIIEDFATREGTDYGEIEVPLDQKVQQILLQLNQKELVLTFDPESESVNILPSHSIR